MSDNGPVSAVNSVNTPVSDITPVSVVNVNTRVSDNTPVTVVSDHVSDGASIAATADIIPVSRENIAATDAIVSDESAATDAGIDPENLFDSVNYSSILEPV